MTAAPIRFGDIELVPDPSLPEGEIGFRREDGVRLCAACGCPEGIEKDADGNLRGHCKVCGCRTRAGQRDECLCARFVATIQVCPHCGHMFGARWKLQNHLLPVPSCQTGARAAAGRFADAPDFAPPLTAHRDRYVRG